MLPQVPRPNKREVVSSYWLWQWKNFCCHLYRSYVTIQGCTEKVQSKRKVFLKKDNYQGSETEEMGWLNNSETESLSLSATINNLRTTVLFWPKSIKVGQVGSSGLNIGWTVAFTSPQVCTGIIINPSNNAESTWKNAELCVFQEVKPSVL